MTDKLIIVLKKLLKFILWLVAVIVFLLVSLIVAIKIPAVQSKLINAATNYVSSRTHTYIAIKKIGISFPKSVYVEGLLLKDLNHDTLLYAGDAKVNMDMIGLLHSKIHFKSIDLENVTAKLSRAENDTTFNFNFLLTAFSDSTKKVKVKQPKSSKTDLSIDDVSLKNIHFTYNDKHSGVYASANFSDLALSIDQLDVDNLIFKVDEVTLENLHSKVIISKRSKSGPSGEPQQMPVISAKSITIKNSAFAFDDLVGKQTVFSNITDLRVKNAAVDLNKSSVNLDELLLAKSNTGVSTTDLPKTGTDSIASVSTSENNWNITAKKIELSDNQFSYNVLNKPELKKVFDAAHIHYKHISLDAKDLFYSTDKILANVNSFTAADSTYFVVNQFSTDFVMNKNSITANKLILKTNNSSINATAGIKYSSLTTIADSIGKLYVNADLKKTIVHTRDILYFSPQLIKQPFFSSAANSVTVSGKVNGTIGHLSGQQLVINTGEKTEIATDFTIIGLPDAENAYFDIPELTVTSGSRDVKKLLGDSLLPKSIALPQDIKLNGKFKGKLKAFSGAVDLKSDFGNAEVTGDIDKAENFSGNLHIHQFNVARLLNDTTGMFGPVTLNAVINGHGLDKEKVQAKITADAPEFYLNKYTYHKLTIDGTASGQKFEGKINLNDPNAVFDFDGIVNVAKDSEQYKFNLNLKGADLQKLKISKDDFRIGLFANADLKGKDLNTMKGTAGITKIVVSHDGKRYVLDSFLLATVNEKGKSELNVSSAIIGIKYAGTFAPAELATQLKRHVDRYFAVSDGAKDTVHSATPQHFTFEIQLHNHPIISEVLLPQLTQFEPGPITGSFDSETDNLKINTAFNKVEYNGFLADNVLIDVHSDASSLNYKVSCLSLSNSQLKFDNFLINGKLAGQKATINVSSIDSLNNKKLAIAATLQKEQDNYKLTIDPNTFFMMNKQWQLSDDNAIVFGKPGFMIHHFVMSNAQSEISVASANDKFNDDIKAEIKNFKLEDVSRIIEKDTSLAEGTLDGTILLKRVNNAYGIVSDISIKQLSIRKVSVGDLTLKANNPTTEKFNIELALSGNGNSISAKGYFLPNAAADALNFDVDIQSLALKTVEAFSLGQVTQTAGDVYGKFSIRGSTKEPLVNGSLTFKDAFVNPAFLNNRLQLKNETIEITPNAVTLRSFTILDKNNHSAVINGSINMDHFSDFKFALSVNTKDFMLFNTTAKDNKVYYGRMIIDSKINVKGTPGFPVISSSIKLKEGSNFTFAVPESKLTTDRGDGVVLFIDSLKVNPILTRDEKTVKQKAELKDFDISSTIEIDKKATLRLLLDPSSNDSLVVKGDAALSFSLDPSGKISLTGAYNLTDGSYLVSLENVVKKKFEIEAGSTIIWNGDPLDADVNINAIYSIRAAPIDLVADQLAGLSEADQSGYRQRYLFYVYLKLKGALMKPEISFEIQLAPEDKGIMGGSVNAKLQQLNEDPSALNKQVFALLVLNRFIQENPLQTETDVAGNAARTTVSKFLSAELNRLSSKVVPGVELNFDVQSYDDYTSGQAQGRTQVEVGVKKNLLDDRASVQVGGTVDVEGEKAQQNNASDITGDVTVEYKLTKDGRYRIKAFRHNQYEGVIEGQLVETGAGVLYVRDFDKWKELLYRSKKKKKELEEKAKQKTEQKPVEQTQEPTDETPVTK
ncbi:MAG: hypothetical protein JWP12_3533 [Bacteroidetes bacterium]|nr:hypothetical protein [Bacteroidota bacterium]